MIRTVNYTCANCKTVFAAFSNAQKYCSKPCRTARQPPQHSCKHGHRGRWRKRPNGYWRCAECTCHQSIGPRARASKLKYLLAHQQMIKDKRRAYRLANPLKVKAGILKWRLANALKVKAKERAYRLKNRATITQLSQQRRRNLHDSYVRFLLVTRSDIKDVPIALIQAKRWQLKIKRYLTKEAT